MRKQQSTTRPTKENRSNHDSFVNCEEHERPTFKERFFHELRGCSVGLGIGFFFLTLHFLGVKIDMEAIAAELERLLISSWNVFLGIIRGF